MPQKTTQTPALNIELARAHPLFISFEGGEGCGKTTQLGLLKTLFEKEKIPVTFTREPGGTPQGEALRAMLLTGKTDKWQPVSEALLLYAARAEHLHRRILPARKEGQWVISDRFADSTDNYQSIRGMEPEQLKALKRLVLGENLEHQPRLTIILDIPVETGLARKGKQFEAGLDESRFENMPRIFHEKIRQGYLNIAKANPQRCRVIDAQGTIDEIHIQIVAVLNDFLHNRFHEKSGHTQKA